MIYSSDALASSQIARDARDLARYVHTRRLQTARRWQQRAHLQRKGRQCAPNPDRQPLRITCLPLNPRPRQPIRAFLPRSKHRLLVQHTSMLGLRFPQPCRTSSKKRILPANFMHPYYSIGQLSVKPTRLDMCLSMYCLRCTQIQQCMFLPY